MRHRHLLLPTFAALALCACSFVGESAVHVETGNQTSGYLTRPLVLTASSDESVQQVAQRVCDNVKPGSVAGIAFVGKVPGPGPINIADWGKYRYECQSVAAATPVAHPAAAPAPASAAAVASGPAPVAVPPAPIGAAALTDAQEQHRRECQRKQGAYQVCVGSCLASSSSASGVVEAECAQHCAAQLPSGCN